MIDGPESLKALVDSTLPGIFEKLEATKPALLIILDAIDKASNEGSILLAKILAFVKPFEKTKPFILGDVRTVKQ